MSIWISDGTGAIRQIDVFQSPTMPEGFVIREWKVSLGSERVWIPWSSWPAMRDAIEAEYARRTGSNGGGK